MTLLILITAVFFVIGLLTYLGYRQDQTNLKRYAPILHKLQRSIRYPYWRLEEMLLENRKENK